MSGIDEKVLSARFDNKAFESNMQTSMQTLDKFSNKLRMENAGKGLADLDKASKSFSLAGIAQGVEGIASKFSALSIVGITALANIVSSAVSAGAQVVKSLTIDPIKTGLNEYETQLNSIQTIMANTQSKGTTLPQVNAALQQLNEYSDKTIYNFAEMARNIGTFTAAGVGLNESVSSIKGIANLAALSGSNSQQAATAMYQLSQAISSGTVRLMDWNSVVNAGMGGEVFQNALKETARAHGVAIDEIIKKEGSFRESLDTGWLTSQVMTETLAKFTGDLSAAQLKQMGYNDAQIKSIMAMATAASDAATKVKTFSQLLQTLQESVQSGWAQSWQILVGDFEEAKALFTDINNVLGAMIGASADSRNAVLQGWKDLGGRKVLIDALSQAFHALMSVLKPIGQAFSEMFPPITAKRLYELTVQFKNFTAGLKLGATDSENLKKTFKGLFAIFQIGGKFISAFVGFLDRLREKFLPTGSSILAVTARLGDFLVRLNGSVTSGDIFNKMFDKIISGITKFAEGIKTAIKSITSFGKATESVSAPDINLDWVDGLIARIKERLAPIGKIGTYIKNLFNTSMKEAGSGGGFSISGFFNFLITLAGEFGKVFNKFMDMLSKVFTKNPKFSAAFDGLNQVLGAGILLAIRSFINTMSKFVNEGGSVFGSVKGLLGSISGVFRGATGALAAMQANLKADMLYKIAGAIAILAGSLFLIAMIDSDKLTISLTAVGVLMGQLMGSMAAFEKIMGGAGFTGMAKVTASMILLAVAVNLLAIAATKLAKLSWEQLAKGLTAVAALMASMVVSAKLLSGQASGMMSAGTGLILFAVAINIMASAVKKLGEMDTEDLKKGLISVGALLGELALFTKFADLNKMGPIVAVGLVIMAAALKVFASAVSDFASMDVGQLTKGLVSIGLILAQIAIFSNTTASGPKMMATAAALVVFGASMKIFASAMGDLGSLSWESLSKGLLGMGSALIMVAGAVRLMPKNTVMVSASMILMATALRDIADITMKFAAMSLEEIGRGLLMLASTLGIVAIAAKLMNGTEKASAALNAIAFAMLIMVPVMKTFGSMPLAAIGAALLMLAGIFVIFGIAGYALGPVVPVIQGLAIGIALFGAAIMMAGVGMLAFAVGFSILSAAFATGSVAIVIGMTALLGLIPFAARQIGLGILMFSAVIAQGGPVITAAMTTIMLSMLKAMQAVAPEFINTIVMILEGLLNAIRRLTPTIVDTLVLMISKMLDALTVVIPKFVDSGMKIIVGVLKGIRDNIEQIVTVAGQIITRFIDALAAQQAGIADAGVRLILSFINGVSNAISSHSGEFRAAGLRLATAIVDGLTGGLASAVQRVVGAAVNLAQQAFEAAKAALGINSPSKKFIWIGESVGDGFVVGLNNGESSVVKSIDNMSGSAVSAMKKGLASVSDLVSNSLDTEPVIRPVIDLDGVRDGLSSMQSMTGGSLDVSSSLNQAARAGYVQPAPIGQNGSDPGARQFNFTQINNSPEALSRLEIYRQTRNQFSMFKEAVGT